MNTALLAKDSLIEQLGDLLSLNQLCAYQLNALWQHLPDEYETCLLAAMSQSLIMNAEDLEQEMSILRRGERQPVPPLSSLSLLAGSAQLTVSGTWYYLEVLEESYQKALLARFSPLCLSLLKEQHKELLDFIQIIKSLSQGLLLEVETIAAKPVDDLTDALLIANSPTKSVDQSSYSYTDSV